MKAEELDTKTRLAYKLSMLDESFRTSIIESINDRIEEVANQRVIEELEKIPHLDTPLGDEIRLSSYYVYKRIKEIKQE
jgi:hypothetical protein